MKFILEDSYYGCSMQINGQLVSSLIRDAYEFERAEKYKAQLEDGIAKCISVCGGMIRAED